MNTDRTPEALGENPLEANLTTEKSSFLIPIATLIKDLPLKDNGNEYVSFQITATKRESDADADKENSNKILEFEIEEKEGRKSFFRRYAGILLTLVCAMFFSLGALLVKLMKHYHPFTLGVFRFQGLLLPSIPLMAYAQFVKKKNIFEPLWPLKKEGNRKPVFLVVLRGVLGCGALIFHFYGLQYLSIADKMTIGSCKPVLVVIVAHIMLKEKCTIFNFLVAILTMFGILIILRLPIITGADKFDFQLLIGTSFALGAILTATFALTATRYLRKIHFSVVNFIFGICGTILCLALAFSFQVFILPKGPRDWLLAISLAAVTLIVQSLFTLALKYEKAGPVSVVRTTETVFAFLWQFLFLGVEPDVFSLVGACVIISGTILTAWSKWLATLSSDNPTRKKYSFILR